MKIVFMGTPEFAAASLKKLLKSRHQVLVVVTVPDKAQGRGQKIHTSAVKKYALSEGLEVLQPESLKDDVFISRLKSCGADAFVVTAYRILPREVFTIPHAGTINVHASLLPKYRGAAPINRALMNGETVTGVTTMKIDARVDTGQILLQEEQKITADMNAGELHDLLAEKGADLLIKTLDLLEVNKIEARMQDDSQATKAPKINRDTQRIEFAQPADQVHNHIRGLSPYPAAICFLEDKQLKIYRSKIIDREERIEPAGTIINISVDCFDVCCNPGLLRIIEVQIQGKKRLAVKDFLNGYNLKEGVILV